MENKQMVRQTKFGWVDLSHISKRGKLFDWKNSVGCSIEFQYKDIIAIMQILEYKDFHHLYVCINGCTDKSLIGIEQILKGEFGIILKQRTSEFRYNIGDIVNNLLIMDAYKKNGHKYYNYECMNDGYKGDILEANLLKGISCPVCANKVVKIGINDIATTNSELASLFLNTDDATKYTQHSGKKAYFKCPRCGAIVYRTIDEVAKNGISCPACSDGISYPNKFIFNFLSQVVSLNDFNFYFKPEKKFEWSTGIKSDNIKLSGDKIYDFYLLLDFPIIIEAHGIQHYDETYFSGKKMRTLFEEQENDALKYNIAIKNGVLPENYIVLDCRYSNTEYIKNSIMSSNLPQLLDFQENQINWDECNKFATSSRVFEACKLWNNGNHVIKDIADKMKINRNTVSNYLRRGFELGILQDPPKHLKRNV